MKSKIYSFAVAVLLTMTVTNGFATTIDENVPRKDRVERRGRSATDKVRLEEIKTRVNEIRDMDKSNLTKAEKKSLKKELKGLKKEARAKGGVYLSVGAIIIIILLLILLL